MFDEHYLTAIEERAAVDTAAARAAGVKVAGVYCAFTPRDLIAAYRIDGVIDLTWDGCHTYNIEAFQVEECIIAAGVPYMHITTDYSENDTGQLKTRIEAFLELLT